MPLHNRPFMFWAVIVAAMALILGQLPKKVAAGTSKAAPAGAYPNPATTPGVPNPTITQANIAETICSKTWSTNSIRPPATYTTKLKLKQLRAMGLTGHAAEYEEDHFIPLEVGGHPTDPRNLWPEPWNLPVGSNDYGAHAKDLVESFTGADAIYSPSCGSDCGTWPAAGFATATAG